MKKVKVKNLKPGDVLASSGLVVYANRGPSESVPGRYWITAIPKSPLVGWVHKYWRPNATVSILDK